MRNGIAWAALVILFLAGEASAEGDISVCPDVSAIKASAFKSDVTPMPAPYNAGYEYDAVTPDGTKWHGETLATKDSFLEPKYELRPDSEEEQDKKIICRYRGTTVTKDKNVVSPYLKLIREK
ncbi:hypothetical protein [Pseudomonas sp. LP_7_YM]|uniref:hypothetical protein n=1 Tax=Pseudomonas sp. LP_7_YM TaxID=2485137 RepID=UPI001061D480|nr:hypothetical protein [Pseudomonas sp. LP_7_YM]TDV59521.1 hypothetical protein EC915_11621 [Pseudomonas sp. LP_7_YM]